MSFISLGVRTLSKIFSISLAFLHDRRSSVTSRISSSKIKKLVRGGQTKEAEKYCCANVISKLQEKYAKEKLEAAGATVELK